MANYHTEGLILARSDFGEADRILTILTQKRGKIIALAKGVRRMESRKGGNVELLNWVNLFLAEGRSMDLVLEVESKETFQSIKEDLILSGYAYHILELVTRLVPERELHPDIFQLAVETLTFMASGPRQIVVRAFEVKLLKCLGFWSRSQIDIEDARVLTILDTLEGGSWEKIMVTNVTEQQAVELSRLLGLYLESILESALRGKKFLEKIRRN